MGTNYFLAVSLLLPLSLSDFDQSPLIIGEPFLLFNFAQFSGLDPWSLEIFFIAIGVIRSMICAYYDFLIAVNHVSNYFYNYLLHFQKMKSDSW